MNTIVEERTEFEVLKLEMTPVPGFSKYLCHTLSGRVWSLISDKWLLEGDCKGTGDQGKYLMTKLKNDNDEAIPMYKHEIILSSAMGVTKEWWLSQGKQIDHVDNNPRNNKLENLRLVSDKENKANSADRCWNKIRLNMEVAQQLRNEFEELENKKVEWYAHKASELGVTPRSVQNIVLGYTYSECDAQC